MGWAARANPVAQAARRRELKPLTKLPKRPTSLNRVHERLWAAFDARLAVALKSKKDAA